MSGVGEAWHLVPGSGHAVELPGGLLLLGLTRAPTTRGDGGDTALGHSRGDSFPCFGEDECPICRLCAQGKSPAKAARFFAAFSVAHAVSTASPPAYRAAAPSDFDVRAPPLV